MEIKNRSASYEYFIEEKFDAGMMLTGTEVKAIRDGRVSFNDSYCLLDRGELYVKGLHISPYEFGSYANHNPTRERKLLLKKKELDKIAQKLKEKGFTIIPLSIYFNERGYAKMKIGLGKGKKLHDKRESIKQRESDREIKRFVK
ncbi:MAG: SsrA-binding protein SmpB [Bacteroidota bacterium]|jgi:SsrA-binding protein|nr:SsrA-binding protein SmpB [Chitinophagaceae bacterium]